MEKILTKIKKNFWCGDTCEPKPKCKVCKYIHNEECIENSGVRKYTTKADTEEIKIIQNFIKDNNVI